MDWQDFLEKTAPTLALLFGGGGGGYLVAVFTAKAKIRAENNKSDTDEFEGVSQMAASFSKQIQDMAEELGRVAASRVEFERHIADLEIENAKLKDQIKKLQNDKG